jgi:hypothetical protein
MLARCDGVGVKPTDSPPTQACKSLRLRDEGGVDGDLR